ncbi:shikimate dehydrogenase family protein [Antarctobacter sp.]|uniref:shikimate dehydrogenase family protein n=1 Tax=Antarctobacter sp. TaxID=1872577 RepID=UPI003A93383A
MTINLNGRTRLYPLLGDPIVYARSPDWLSNHMAKRGMNCISLPMEVPEGKLDVVMQGLAATTNVDGVSFTMPHKTAGFAYCATVTETSRLLGVVSAARRNKDGSWHGHTTDGDAFVKAQIDKGATVKGARVLVLGAGGAGSAIVISMLDQGAGEVVVHDADESRAAGLVEMLKAKAGDRVRVGSNDPTGFDLVSNATPMGMDAGDPLPLDPAKLTAGMFVGDVIAGHGETALIKAARAAGCRTADGDDMVVAVLDVMCDLLEDAWT